MTPTPGGRCAWGADVVEHSAFGGHLDLPAGSHEEGGAVITDRNQIP
jgi:hypothetical protein